MLLMNKLVNEIGVDYVELCVFRPIIENEVSWQVGIHVYDMFVSGERIYAAKRDSLSKTKGNSRFTSVVLFRPGLEVGCARDRPDFTRRNPGGAIRNIRNN